MNSRMGRGKGYAAGSGNGTPSPKSNSGRSGSSQDRPNLDQMNRDIANCHIDPPEDDQWEVVGKKSKNRPGSGAPKFMASTTAVQSAGIPKQGNSVKNGATKSGYNNLPPANDSRRPVGRGNPRSQAPNNSWDAPYMVPPPHMVPPPAIPAPLQHGWQWAGRGGSQFNKGEQNFSTVTPVAGFVSGYGSDPDTEPKQPYNDSDEEELAEDSDDQFSEDSDSDASQKSFETRKNNRWFKDFFRTLDKLSVDELNEQSRQWHCPACHDGPGAIDWYKGFQPLVSHAKTKGATRVKLHREFAELLEEELQRKGSSVVPRGEAFGKWKGLRDPTTDHEIVWPPMVVIMNTILEKDDNDKWIGMGNQELLDYFSTYAAQRAKHAYGPRGHRGISLLMFEADPMGYLEAERLHKHFVEEGRDKDAWECRKVLFGPGGKRRLYGYLASKEDIDNFNQHAHGKARLRFEVKSYQEMVVIPMKQMSQDNQQLTWYKNKAVKQEQRSKVLQESFGQVTQKLRETMEENRIVRLRTKIQHEENKEQMDYQDQYYKEQIEKVHKDMEEKERGFEKELQEARAKAEEFGRTQGTKENQRARKEETSRFIDSQVKGVEDFEVEREKLIHAHEDKKVALRRKHLEEEVDLEKEFAVALSELMNKYTPTSFQASSK